MSIPPVRTSFPEDYIFGMVIFNDWSETRTLRQVTIDSAAEADRIFSMLMGDEVPPRRAFIEQNAKYAKIDI